MSGTWVKRGESNAGGPASLGAPSCRAASAPPRGPGRPGPAPDRGRCSSSTRKAAGARTCAAALWETLPRGRCLPGSLSPGSLPVGPLPPGVPVTRCSRGTRPPAQPRPSLREPHSLPRHPGRPGLPTAYWAGGSRPGGNRPARLPTDWLNKRKAGSDWSDWTPLNAHAKAAPSSKASDRWANAIGAAA